METDRETETDRDRPTETDRRRPTDTSHTDPSQQNLGCRVAKIIIKQTRRGLQQFPSIPAPIIYKRQRRFGLVSIRHTLHCFIALQLSYWLLLFSAAFRSCQHASHTSPQHRPHRLALRASPAARPPGLWLTGRTTTVSTPRSSNKRIPTFAASPWRSSKNRCPLRAPRAGLPLIAADNRHLQLRGAG